MKVRNWVDQRSYTLETVCGLELRETDFTDDRLSIRLRRLSQSDTWSKIETHLSQESIRVYSLPTEQLRFDATTNSGYHQVSEEGLFQFGKSKDNPNLAEGLLRYSYDYEVPTPRRAGRYQITAVTRHQKAIEQVEKRFGWRAYVTNAPKKRLSVPQGLLTYRDEWIVEGRFHRLKGVPLSLSRNLQMLNVRVTL